MSTLTPLHPVTPTPSERVATSAPRAIPAFAKWAYHAVQTVWLVAMVATAISAGHSVAGFVVLWLVGAGVIATIDFVYREFLLHDHPSSSR